jgi:hypothetical protein
MGRASLTLLLEHVVLLCDMVRGRGSSGVGFWVHGRRCYVALGIELGV